MEHYGTVRLETRRLILRPFTMEDARAAFKNWMHDSEVTRFLRWKPHKDVKESEAVIKRWISSYVDKDFYQWAIVLKDIGEPIGTISVVDKNEYIDMLHVGYCLGLKWWRQGIMSEAFSHVIEFLFSEVKANRIESMHDPNNPNSGKVMAKCGLKYEGTHRQADFNNQGVVDVAVYAILAEDFYAGR